MKSSLKFSVDPDLAAQGIIARAAVCRVLGNPRRRGSGLEHAMKEVCALLLSKIDGLLASPVLAEYRRLQQAAGIEQPEAPAERLLKLLQKSGRLPNINRAVDSYNMESARTLLSMGAHDMAKITGDVRLRTTDGSEKYTPLGEVAVARIAAGEYAAVDDEKVLCRLDVRQCDETKCGEETKEFLVYVQGNKETTPEYVEAGLQKVCDNMKAFCGAEYVILEAS